MPRYWGARLQSINFGGHNSTYNIRGTACVKGNEEQAGQAGKSIRDGERGCRPPDSLKQGQQCIGESMRQNQPTKSSVSPKNGSAFETPPNSVIGGKQPIGGVALA